MNYKSSNVNTAMHIYTMNDLLMSFSHEETWSDVVKNYGRGVSKSVHVCDHVYLEADDVNNV